MKRERCQLGWREKDGADGRLLFITRALRATWSVLMRCSRVRAPPPLLLLTPSSMSSSVAKARLKASREAIQAKQWDRAAEEAGAVLEAEPDNYNALVFRGLALLNLKQHEESESAYRAAVAVQPLQILAWQGLHKFYSETQAWDKLADVLRRQMDIALEG